MLFFNFITLLIHPNLINVDLSGLQIKCVCALVGYTPWPLFLYVFVDNEGEGEHHFLLKKPVQNKNFSLIFVEVGYLWLIYHQG